MAEVNAEQAKLLALLAVTLVFFVWGRWRYDLVAFSALVLAVLLGLVPAEHAFSGFSHPAVVTVALVLVLSQGLTQTGAIDKLAAFVVPATDLPVILVSALAVTTAILSAFMNNVGALALMMPLAIQACSQMRISPSIVLMPLSFASLLGGMATLIGTPPNIIIAGFRAEVTGSGFAMFDFAPVGTLVAAAGILFVALVGWRLLPRDRLRHKPHEELFDIEPYMTEVRVTDGSKAVGRLLREIGAAADEIEVVAVIRDGRSIPSPDLRGHARAGDILVLRADAEDLKRAIEGLGLELVGEKDHVSPDLRSDSASLAEAVIMPGSLIEGHTARSLQLRSRYGVNLLAVSRRGRQVHDQLRALRLAAGDILLLQGETDRMPETTAALGCAPLAERGLRLAAPPSRALIAGCLFGLAIAAVVAGLLPVAVAFGVAVVGYVVTGVISLRDAYESVEWPVVVLLAAMIPIGIAADATGAANLVANGLLRLVGTDSPLVALALVLILTMGLTDVMNNAATAIVMAPISIGIARQLGVSVDPFLMAVAIGASSAFLTPIGHQNNTLILGPGGYRFGDYWRMGLPLDALVLAAALLALPVFWPFS